MGQQLTGRGSIMGVGGDGGLQVRGRRPFMYKLHQTGMYVGSLTSVCTVQTPTPKSITFFLHITYLQQIVKGYRTLWQVWESTISAQK